MSTLLKAMYRFNVITIKISTTVFNLGKRNAKIHRETQAIPKKVKWWQATKARLEISHYQVSRWWYRHKIFKWNRIEILEMNSHVNSQLRFDKQTDQSREKDKWGWENWLYLCRSMKQDPCPIPYKKSTLNRPSIKFTNWYHQTTRQRLCWKINKWDTSNLEASALRRKSSTKWRGNHQGRRKCKLCSW